MKSESPASESRVAANRANAQLSTGPISPAGKAISRMNAVKTGLTGRTVLLPSDDVEAYRQHLTAYENEYKPVGVRECELVQSLADLQWRLQRIPGLEMAIYARGHDEFDAQFEELDPSIRSARIDLEIFIQYEKPLRNLQLQEGRLRRHRQTDLAELQQLQERRRLEEDSLASFFKQQDAARKLARQDKAARHTNVAPLSVSSKPGVVKSEFKAEPRPLGSVLAD
jgi:hypothetical protein